MNCRGTCLILAFMFTVFSGNARDYLRAAEELRANGEYADAALYLEATVKDNPNCLECWQLLAENYEAGKRPLKALDTYQRMRELAPDNKKTERRIAELADAAKLTAKREKKRQLSTLRRNSGWGALTGVPGGLSFARRLQDIYMVSLLLGSRFDGQIAFESDLLARFPLNTSRTSYFSFGIGWCILAGGVETVGQTVSGRVLSAARETRSGPSALLSLSRFSGGTELFVQGSVVMSITPKREYLPGGGIGVRWYIE
jgi:tetratricopeptide (TPR) repeat protein